jgi:hypothetical protein
MDLSLTFLDIVKIRDSQPGVCVPLGVCKQVSGGTKCSKQNKNNSVTTNIASIMVNWDIHWSGLVDIRVNLNLMEG